MFESAHVCRESLHRCNADPIFIDLFYEKFLASSDEVAEKFSNTNFKKQKQMLRKSLHLIVLSCGGQDEADVYLPEVAKRHGRKGLQIKPAMYELWLESLIETVQEIDPKYSAEVEQAWRETMRYGIDYMISRA